MLTNGTNKMPCSGVAFVENTMGKLKSLINLDQIASWALSGTQFRFECFSTKGSYLPPISQDQLSNIKLNLTNDLYNITLGTYKYEVNLNSFTFQKNSLTHIMGDISYPLISISGFMRINYSFNTMRNNGRYLGRRYPHKNSPFTWFLSVQNVTFFIN